MKVLWKPKIGLFLPAQHKPTHQKPDMYSGYKCPANPEHGQLLFLANTVKLYCPHSDHTKTNPPTVALFDLTEVDKSYIKAMAAQAKRQYIKRKTSATA